MDIEETFNLAIRRMLRASGTHYVLHIALSSFGFIRGNPELLLFLQNTVKDLAQPMAGVVYPMRRGDQFVVLTGDHGSKVSEMADYISAAAFPERDPKSCEDHALVRVFLVPRDYTALRETANACMEVPAKPGEEAAGGQTIRPIEEDLDGLLNAWALNRLEVALAEIDLSPYLRAQTVYETDHQGHWTPLFEECFTSISDLRKDKFPKLTLQAEDRMFAELCRALDRRSVPEILRRHRAKPGHRHSLNVSLATCQAAPFERFVRESSDLERRSLILELNRSDLLHRPRDAVKMLTAMHEAGFGTALDGITLDLLPFINVHRLEVDYFKIALAPAQMSLLKDADCVASLKRLPRGKIILCRCEKESALPVGQAFGLTKFQGWVIDRLATGRSAT
jgi:EAL domain-containing protein (putative c-di-GMP-specific phosphodiesterase class I)